MSKNRNLESAHPALQILPHHEAEKEKVLRLAILEEVKEPSTIMVAIS